MTLTLSDEAREFLIENGSNLEMGARPLRRAVERFLEDALSEVLLRGELEDSNKVLAEVDHDSVEEGPDGESRPTKLKFEGQSKAAEEPSTV